MFRVAAVFAISCVTELLSRRVDSGRRSVFYRAAMVRVLSHTSQARVQGRLSKRT